jgi:hypothetical protein
MKERPNCCTGDWGWPKEVYGPVRKKIQNGLPPGEALGGFHGCMTNMILGVHGCMSGHIPRAGVCRAGGCTGIAEAKRRINEFLFVGIIDEWTLSTCLYNYLTTGYRHIYGVQLHNSRPTNGTNENRTAYNVNEIPPDPADAEVYNFARERFWGDIEKNNITLESCSPAIDLPNMNSADISKSSKTSKKGI